MATDPLLFIADLLNTQMRTREIHNRNSRFPSINIQRWISSESSEFPTISLFAHQQTTTTSGFEGKHYLNVRQIRLELRTDDVEELHTLEEEIQYCIVSHCNRPQSKKYPDPGIEWMRIGSSVDVFETIVDTIVYRRSILIDCFSQYSYVEDR